MQQPNRRFIRLFDEITAAPQLRRICGRRASRGRALGTYLPAGTFTPHPITRD